jgi:hypothetical protein
MMANTMAFNNAYPFPTTTPTMIPATVVGAAPAPSNPAWFSNF